MGQKSRWTLPEVVYPTGYRRFVICVPDEQFYIAAFQGLLIELTYSKNWQRDPAHTAAIVSRIWQQALANVLCDDCGEVILHEESEYEMALCEQLRFHNGKLQALCCGEWTTIDGQEGIVIGGSDQEGSGAEQPDPGECATYHASFQANSQYLVPTVVNAGDTVEVTNISGAGWDGVTLGLWYCPNGQIFFAGGCAGPTTTDGGDPDPSLPHMGLIVGIDGTWYDANAGLITVPGGVVNAPVVIQVNDGTLGDNAGSYALDVEVCNNEAVEWERILDLELNDYGFVGSSFPGYDGGVWVPGNGWEATDEFDGSNWARHLQISKTWAVPVTLTYQEWDYTVVRGPEIVALDDSIRSNGGDRATHNNSSGTFALSYSGTLTAQTSIGFNCYVSQQTSHGSISGSVKATRIVLRGLGTPPF